MAKDFSSQQVVEGYDQHIRKLIPGYEVVHQQIQALLKTYLPESAHILVVGCGTGYELGYLLQAFPNWHFTATDLSAAMLDKARTSLQDLNVEHRVDFHLGDVHELENIVSFDAALSILVTHFVAFPQKLKFLQAIQKRLKTEGLFITFDLTEISSEPQQRALKNICESNGLTQTQTTAMLKRLADDFYALTDEQTFELLEHAEFNQVARFTQILNYQGFLAFSK
ncbi:class I SAM-dependent methyltransferase [Acinetobacter ursingii]|uniref:class I SAM-dependent methyltransferase n=1 Tax=Acinetobacter ursingii TaxID=108980 RepID=UPI00124D949B|nr:class I SAM-dependent methyltransferase [Acinetobacter ursingii]MDA3579640.1 class I SAM-dependent methyltransferase [Acinetobacter ursingii]MDG9860589.1 class I SAM-dependent methyltransferase [Acinetobacter ursingii]MDG9894294.1 class I SAM-dependent methyltransferase [Acinetobacter ursingii]MDH0007796.1 class I SAM-dependent methyltransferase [Acinetobacter ursingii]MDH0479578.1 class I SAM-dependent methyltransferase [Acinetobacter ursingii]